MDLVTAAFGIAGCVLILVAEHRKHEKEEAEEALRASQQATLAARHEAATWRPAHIERRVHVLFEPVRGARRLERVSILCAHDEPGLEHDRLWVQLTGDDLGGPFSAVWRLGRMPDGEWGLQEALEGAAAEAAIACLAGEAGGAVAKA